MEYFDFFQKVSEVKNIFFNRKLHKSSVITLYDSLQFWLMLINCSKQDDKIFIDENISINRIISWKLGSASTWAIIRASSIQTLFFFYFLNHF